MSNIDWRDPARKDIIHFKMVSPNNLDEVAGDLTDVQLGSSSITYGYYADTRYSSGISFLKSNNYIENAWVRIIHEVPSANYVSELGTFIPTSPSESRNGATIVTLDLQSPLWGLKDDYTTSKFSIAKNTSYVDAFIRVCDTCNRPYVLNSPNITKATKAIVYDIGESYLDILFDICDKTDNRIDLDGHGRITLSPTIDHSLLTPTWTLDYDDPRSMIIEGSLKMDPQVDDIPSRAIVINGNIVGVVDVPDGLSYSASARGYIKAAKYSESSANNASKAKSMAQTYLNSYSQSNQWTMDCLYFPCSCGENVNLIIDGEKHYCMIQSIDPLNLDTMTMTLTLKEVNYSG